MRSRVARRGWSGHWGASLDSHDRHAGAWRSYARQRMHLRPGIRARLRFAGKSGSNRASAFFTFRRFLLFSLGVSPVASRRMAFPDRCRLTSNRASRRRRCALGCGRAGARPARVVRAVLASFHAITLAEHARDARATADGQSAKGLTTTAGLPRDPRMVARARRLDVLLSSHAAASPIPGTIWIQANSG